MKEGIKEGKKQEINRCRNKINNEIRNITKEKIYFSAFYELDRCPVQATHLFKK